LFAIIDNIGVAINKRTCGRVEGQITLD